MKKLFSGILVMLLLMALVVSPASAGWGSSQSCGVSVWVDATNYSTSATTVDWKASKGSECGKVYYKTYVEQFYNDSWHKVGLASTGYFSTATPVKAIPISWIKSFTPYKGVGAEIYRVHIKLYNSSDYVGLLGGAQSHRIYIY